MLASSSTSSPPPAVAFVVAARRLGVNDIRRHHRHRCGGALALVGDAELGVESLRILLLLLVGALLVPGTVTEARAELEDPTLAG